MSVQNEGTPGPRLAAARRRWNSRLRKMRRWAGLWWRSTPTGTGHRSQFRPGTARAAEAIRIWTMLEEDCGPAVEDERRPCGTLGGSRARGRRSTRRWRPWTGDDAAAGNGSEGRRGGAEGGEAKKQRAGALLPGGWGGSRWRRPGTGRGGHGSSKEGGGWSWSPAMEAEQRTGEAEEPMADAGGRARRHGEATTRRREGCRGNDGGPGTAAGDGGGKASRRRGWETRQGRRSWPPVAAREKEGRGGGRREMGIEGSGRGSEGGRGCAWGSGTG